MSESLERFGPFLLGRRVGRGGMGEVHLARCPWPDIPIGVVKRLHKEGAELPKAEARFEHEADLALRLQHPHVVTTLDVGDTDGRTYVASELILGKDIGWIADRLLERRLGAPVSASLSVLIDILDAFSYIHEASSEDGAPLHLVHRDVKPGNILLGYDGVAKLADFGLAKSTLTLEMQLTGAHQLLGTPTYLAPEMISGEPPTAAADLYGLGAVLYRLLTGSALFAGSVAEVIHQVATAKPRPIKDFRPDLPEWLSTLITMLLDKDPARRPDDSASLRKAVEEKAGRDHLLAPRSATGRWLQSLFAAEYADEQLELVRLASFPPLPVVDEDSNTSPAGRPRLVTPVRPGSRRTSSLLPELSVALLQPIGPQELSDDGSGQRGTVVEDLRGGIPTQRLSPVTQRALELALGNEEEATIQSGAGPGLQMASIIQPVSAGPTRPTAPAPPILAAGWIPPSTSTSSSSGAHEPALVTPAPSTVGSWLRLGAVGAAGVAIAWLFLSWPFAADNGALEARYQRAKEQLTLRRAQGQHVPAEAWELSANAASALLDHDDSNAEAAIVALERLIVSPDAGL